MYNLSRDYRRLFELICNGDTIVAFVDYRQRDKTAVRDVCQVKRHSAFDISVGARGISYGDVYKFMEKHGDEVEVFIKHCTNLNLEWICPQPSFDNDLPDFPDAETCAALREMAITSTNY